MSNELTVQDGRNTNIITFDDEKVGLIKRTIAKGATDDELALFLHQAQKTGLDPLARQIYFQKYNTKSGPQIAIITGIDGYRLVADRTGRYAGSDEPRFDGRLSATFYKDTFDAPVKATVTVYKIVGNRRVGFSSSVYWTEYYPGEPKGHMWRKMPHVMLAKCAEAAALRKAFPADLSGVYTHEEMGQADWFNQERDVIEADFDQTNPAADDDFNQDTDRVESDAGGPGDMYPGSPPTPNKRGQKPSPKAQAQEPEATGDPVEPSDYLEAAVSSANLKNFAENIVAAGVGYTEVPHVVTALTTTYADEMNEKFMYPDKDPNKRRVLVNWLVDRKAA